VRFGLFLAAASAAFFVALASAAAAFDVDDPPAAFDGLAPNKRVLHLPLAEIDFACRSRGTKASDKLRVVGCARRYSEHFCDVILPDPRDVSAAEYRDVERHEQAHCNGWVHPEPD
jgi:hypothetical protein